MTKNWLRPDLQYFYDMDEKNLLATCIYGEAAGESYAGKFAVGCVIRNRVRMPGWWGDSYHRVILAPEQFSCFNEGSPTLPHMRKPQNDVWESCLDAAHAILNDEPDTTDGATHYFNPKVVLPAWSSKMIKTVSIGNHDFYRDPHVSP